MSGVARFTVSMEAELLARFDAYCAEAKLPTRSEAVRQMVHDTLTARASAEAEAEVSATLTLVYDHHKAGLTDKLVEIQHSHGDLVVAAMHVHLDHHTCLEVIVLRGKGTALQAVADDLSSLKGIHKGQLVFATSCGHR